MKIVLKSPAKVNLFLEIKSKRKDGYHNLESIMQTISLYDELSFEDIDKNIILSCDNKALPCDKTNLVYKAALAIKTNFNINKGVKIYLKKNIPQGAGLGGGSSNAATTILALVKLWNIKTTQKELETVATKLGADVPFFLTGGTCLCEGIGEIVTPLKSITNLDMILVNPGFGISTVGIYKKINFPLTNSVKIHKIKHLISSSSFNNKEAFKSCFNRLEEFVFGDFKTILEIKTLLSKLCCTSLMSGSGATVFGILDINISKEHIVSELKKYSWDFCFTSTTNLSVKDQLKNI
ncbi:MAG: 4-(cytidine 5'-diphospho)-2-C-methyl-D-erythritol kinase [Endomicrobium sp.]|jgi:4-diphosphocytidyl-2-C-methyl-D-erythritol kinase|nr:4-(cytidine 5'-diphospho)-2-C-methyl-D-erythritol kinase [Endomicrobium sp.]